MRRTPQEMIELAVFGLIGLLVGTGVLWLVGSLLRLIATLFVWIAAALWALISFLVPVALVAGAIVLVVRWAQGRPWQPFGASEAATAAAPYPQPAPQPAPPPAADPSEPRPSENPEPPRP